VVVVVGREGRRRRRGRNRAGTGLRGLDSLECPVCWSLEEGASWQVMASI